MHHMKAYVVSGINHDIVSVPWFDRKILFFNNLPLIEIRLLIIPKSISSPDYRFRHVTNRIRTKDIWMLHANSNQIQRKQ